MKNLPKEKRSQIILTGFGALAACAVLWYLVIRTQQGVIKATLDKTTLKRQEVVNAERMVKQSNQIEADMEVVAERLRAIEDTMVQGDMYSWIIKTMNRFLVNQRVDIPTFTPPGVAEVGMLPQFPYKAATYAIRGSGYFHDFGKFLADFENQFPCARIQNIDMEPIGILAAKPEDADKVSFRFEIVTLIKPSTVL